jgi:hypothetical protein
MSIDLYEVGPRRNHRRVDLIPDALPFGRLRYAEPNAVSNAVEYAKFCRRASSTSPTAKSALTTMVRSNQSRSTRTFCPQAYEKIGAATTKGRSLDETSRTPPKGFHEIRSATLG